MDLQERVKTYIESHGIKKGYFAKQVGISSAILSRWFAHDYDLRPGVTEAIEKIINK